MEYNLTNYQSQDLQSYIRYIKSLDYLDQEEEFVLAKEVRKWRDSEAAKRLVLSHLRLVLAIAYKYNGYGLQMADLIQEGTIGLMKAVKRFDERIGVRLVTFASYWIKAEIVQFILNNWRLVKVATTAAQKKLFFKLRSYKNTCGRMSYQEVKQISEDFNVKKEDVTSVNGYLSHPDFSIYSEYQDESTEHYLLSDESSSPQTIMLNNDLNQVYTEKLPFALSKLDARKQYIIKNRWLNDNNKLTLHDIAKHFKISLERVRQLEQEAIKEMKKYLPCDY